MASCLVGGLVNDGYPPSKLWVSDPDSSRLRALESRYGVSTTSDNSAAGAQADILVLAVKPQVLEGVSRGLAPVLAPRRPLVISIAAGIREAALASWLGSTTPIVRVMPNTPAMIGAGASAMHANDKVSDEQKDAAESVLRAVGLTLWVDDESAMDAVTALSGSGPAYFFLIMEAMERAGRDLGLTPETARLLTLQTALGAARMAIESSDPPEVLRQRVTSPGGTTERALDVLETGGLRSLFHDALSAARKRSVELSAMLGNS